MIIRNLVDEKIAMMQLLLADIPAPVDLKNGIQQFYAYQNLYRVHVLALAARNDVFGRYTQRGRPPLAGLDRN